MNRRTQKRAGEANPRRRQRDVSRPMLLANENLPAPPTQKRSLDKRERLKAAALELFREKGYARTSIDDIAAGAKVPVGGFYLHFRSKRQVLLTLMDDLLVALSTIGFLPADGAHPRDGIRSLLTQAFARDLHFLGAYRAWQEAVFSEPDLTRCDAAIHAWTRQRVIALFQRLQELPRARRGVDIPQLASVMDRLYWALLSEALSLDPQQITQRVRATADVTYHALFTDSASGQG
jgi:AcrR family transcriptional regulator